MDAAVVSREIHPQDLMWIGGPEWYFSVGEDGLRVVRTAISLSWLKSISSFLDLPCGHGRVARHLRAAYPAAAGYFCDIDESGVDFCARTFAGTGIVSKPELTEVSFPSVDVIWVGSLFTHVDFDRSQRWLAYLAAHLNPQGVLVATFHGRWSVEVHKKYPMIHEAAWQRIVRDAEATGYGYAKYEDPSAGDYGISLTRPAIVCDMVDAIAGVKLIGYIERGWADNHDVVMIAKNDRLRPW
jgi:SAM-dependent methyltransferase